MQGKVPLLPLLVAYDERIVDGDSPRAAGEAELLRQRGKQALAAVENSVIVTQSIGRVGGVKRTRRRWGLEKRGGSWWCCRRQTDAWVVYTCNKVQLHMPEP